MKSIPTCYTWVGESPACPQAAKRNIVTRQVKGEALRCEPRRGPTPSVHYLEFLLVLPVHNACFETTGIVIFQ